MCCLHNNAVKMAFPVGSCVGRGHQCAACTITLLRWPFLWVVV